jgi:hypothetical protein
MLLLFSILKLSVKVNRDANNTQITSENILICSELVSLPETLCYVCRVSTRDVAFRKYNLPCNNQHRYGLNLQINRKISHASILLLLAGDIATNPGPYKHTIVKTSSQNVSHSMLEVWWVYIKPTSETIWQILTGIERFQNLVYSENPDIVCVNETWLNNEDIKNSEILHSGYDIFRTIADLVVEEYC